MKETQEGLANVHCQRLYKKFLSTNSSTPTDEKFYLTQRYCQEVNARTDIFIKSFFRSSWSFPYDFMFGINKFLIYTEAIYLK